MNEQSNSHIVTTGLPLALILLPPIIFFSMSLEQAPALSVFTTTVLLWFTEALPLPVTGLLVPVLAVLYSVLEPGRAFAAFGSDILYLFVGAFLLAGALHKHRWDRRMAYWILSTRIGAARPWVVIVFVGFICWLLSMWISNTACCAMMTPLCLGMVSIYKTELKTEAAVKNFRTRLLLTCAFGSSVGGLATPVGSPPNLIAIQLLKDEGINVSFFRWMEVALPVSLAMLLVVLFLLAVIFPVRNAASKSISQHFKEQLASLGKFSREEELVSLVFSITVFLWIMPGVVKQLSPELYQTYDLSKFSMSVVGLIGGLVLFLLPTSPGSEDKTILTWKDGQAIDWGTLVLFGGGLTLGVVLSDSGLAREIGEAVFYEGIDIWMLVVIATVVGIIMSEFASNTASASIVIPIIMSLTLFDSQSDMLFAVAAATFGASFGFMLPVSTPPNAIVYGTGKIRIRDMIKAGILFDILGAATIIAYIHLLISWF